jgi:F-type H+-transporting ATPase subunit gamma
VANQKEIRSRIASVKNTQKITRAMKMVAGARLSRAQQQIQALRPYAVETAQVLHSVVGAGRSLSSDDVERHPLLARRPVKRLLLLVMTSDRGLCGAFNTNILRHADARWRAAVAEGLDVQLYVVGRKGRDYFRRRGAPLAEYYDGVWDRVGLDQARRIARGVLRPFLEGKVDAISVVYNEFKSAMTQTVVEEPLFPLSPRRVTGEDRESEVPELLPEYEFEPDKDSLLEVLVPMYIEVTLLRALYESSASQLGAQMTAMDSATKNAKELIQKLTLQYNRARQAAITTELMEIIGGAEALAG